MEDTAPRKTPSAEVPVIDLDLPSLEHEGEASEEWKRVARHLCDAFTNVGCAYLTNHGIPDDQLSRLFTSGAEFFSLDQDTKNCYLLDIMTRFGYVAPYTERYGDGPELHESFLFTTDEGRFPDAEVPSLRLAVSSFIKSFKSLSTRIFTTIALGLGIDRDHVISMHKGVDTDDNYTCFRMNYCPSAPSTVLDDTTLFGAHTDVSTFSLLFQDDIGGFQICDSDGTWLNVDPLPGAVLILSGDFSKFFLEDKFLHIRHRVVIPAEELRKSKPRLSDGYFVSPDIHLPLPYKYASSTEGPITVRDHIFNKLASAQIK